MTRVTLGGNDRVIQSDYIKEIIFNCGNVESNIITMDFIAAFADGALESLYRNNADWLSSADGRLAFDNGRNKGATPRY